MIACTLRRARRSGTITPMPRRTISRMDRLANGLVTQTPQLPRRALDRTIGRAHYLLSAATAAPETTRAGSRMRRPARLVELITNLRAPKALARTRRFRRVVIVPCRSWGFLSRWDTNRRLDFRRTGVRATIRGADPGRPRAGIRSPASRAVERAPRAATRQRRSPEA
jgi:hypothetical protein